MDHFSERLWLPSGDGGDVVGYMAPEQQCSFEFCDDALGAFCFENGIDPEEIDTLLSSRRLLKERPVLANGVLLVGAVTILSKLYRGLAVEKVLGYDDCPRYFFVHRSGESGYYPACIVGDVTHYVPCVDISDGSPIVVMETGGVGCMKAYDSSIFLVSRSAPSTVSPAIRMCQSDERPYPISVERPATDCMYGDEFAMGYRHEDGHFYFPSVGFAVEDRLSLDVSWIMLSKCGETQKWNYVDCIGRDRAVYNACMTAYYGTRSKGYFVSYSITDSFNVQRDLCGFFNRINFNMSRGLELPENFPDQISQKLRSIFCHSNFNFDKVFGTKYSMPVKTLEADREIHRVVSHSCDSYYVNPAECGVVSICDVIRGLVFGSQDVLAVFEQLIPPFVYSDLKSKFPDTDLGSCWKNYLADFVYGSSKVSESLRQLVLTRGLMKLSKNDCLVLFFALLGVNCYVEMSDICVIEVNRRFQMIIFCKFPVIVFGGTLIYLRFPKPYSYLDFIDRRRKILIDRGPCFYGVSDGSISKMFSLGCHVMYKKRLKMVSN